MVKIAQAILVEGRYDKNTLSQIVDAPIFVTNGFGIFRDRERMYMLRAVAEKRGLVVLTDSDGAGLVIRNRLKSAIPARYLLHAYIPDVFGKEKRKASPGKEGKLGVEGMEPRVLLEALRRAGATFLDEEPHSKNSAGASVAPPVCEATDCPAGVSSGAIGEGFITKTDLYELGLAGKPDSRERRLALQRKLGLPAHLSANALLTALNCMSTRDELMRLAGQQESQS